MAWVQIVLIDFHDSDIYRYRRCHWLQRKVWHWMNCVNQLERRTNNIKINFMYEFLIAVRCSFVQRTRSVRLIYQRLHSSQSSIVTHSQSMGLKDIGDCMRSSLCHHIYIYIDGVGSNCKKPEVGNTGWRNPNRKSVHKIATNSNVYTYGVWWKWYTTKP